MKDNIYNDIHIGDFVFCYSGQYKNKIKKVTGFRTCNGESLNGVTNAVNFEGSGWLSATNVISLNALGADISTLPSTKLSIMCDALGNQLHVGDRVLYLHALEMYADIGIVKKLSTKTCLLTINRNRFGQEEYRKKFEEVISLAALGIEKIPKRNWNGDVVNQ